MAAIAVKSAELQGLAVVGVDIDTVKSQMEEYKVSIINLLKSIICVSLHDCTAPLSGFHCGVGTKGRIFPPWRGVAPPLLDLW